MSRQDAEVTLRFAIVDAIASTAHVTGMRAGAASEALEEAVFKSITDSSTAWALAYFVPEDSDDG